LPQSTHFLFGNLIPLKFFVIIQSYIILSIAPSLFVVSEVYTVVRLLETAGIIHIAVALLAADFTFVSHLLYLLLRPQILLVCKIYILGSYLTDKYPDAAMRAWVTHQVKPTLLTLYRKSASSRHDALAIPQRPQANHLPPY